jgi:molybdopterin molybdotransferase
VFGLPGNPVSSVVDFLVFARPALLKMMGSASPVHPMPAVPLAEPIKRRPGRRAYIPVRVTVGEHGDFLALPLPSMGSADLVALSRANALGIVHESEGSLPKGAPIRVLLLDDTALR